MNGSKAVADDHRRFGISPYPEGKTPILDSPDTIGDFCYALNYTTPLYIWQDLKRLEV